MHGRFHWLAVVLLLFSISFTWGIVVLAEESPSPESASAGDAATEPDPVSALEELLQTVDAAEGVSEQSKRQLRERLLRIAERMDRFGAGVDQDAAIVAELEALRDEEPELATLVDAILAAHQAGHDCDAIVAILSSSDVADVDDPTLAVVAEIFREVELAQEDVAALLDALQTEPEPSGALNRGQVVSTMAHIRNLQRKAQRDGVELTDEQLIQLAREGLSGHLSDEEIRAITEAALNSDRGMSRAVGHIRNAVNPKKNTESPSDGEDPDPESSGAQEDDEAAEDSAGGDGPVGDDPAGNKEAGNKPSQGNSGKGGRSNGAASGKGNRPPTGVPKGNPGGASKGNPGGGPKGKNK